MGTMKDVLDKKIYCYDCKHYNISLFYKNGCVHPTNTTCSDFFDRKRYFYKEEACIINRNNDCINFEKSFLNKIETFFSNIFK